MKQYYYTDGVNKYGPMPIEELKTKGISAETLVWYVGIDNWIAASQVPELKAMFKDEWNSKNESSFWDAESKNIDTTENHEIRDHALNVLSSQWGIAIGTFLVYTLILMVTQFIPIIGAVGSLIIGGPLLLGLSIFSLKLSRKQFVRIEQLFEGFQNFATALGAYLLMVLFTLLWMLLLIIPGIIASISYAQTFYIIAEDETIGPMDAIDKSKKMMYGYKWKYFLLNLSFIGWILLSIMTLGIGFLWLIPYMQVSRARFYDLVKHNNI
ncbi:MAG: hypothetical protein DRI84_00445 [Bacteroidetes bacterium]|nr:MAG: hypothetical protein DRI84_00445 [Bacteroidota bacterium]